MARLAAVSALLALAVPLLTVPAFVVPGADFPPWAPWAAGAMGLAGLGVLVWQAVRYFRDHPDD